MKCWAMWFGGVNYAHPERSERFDSLGEAVAVFGARLDGHDPVEGLATPCVESPEMLVYFGQAPEGQVDPYPDRLVRLGPKGGVKVERC